MPVNLAPDHFSRIVTILSTRPEFMNPLTRLPFVTEMLTPSPRAVGLLSRLPMSMVNTRADAVSLVNYLVQFGQDIPGRETLTLVIRALLEVTGEGEDRTFLLSLYEEYPLESVSGGKTLTLLFMTANPTATARLRLDEEQREVDDALLKSRYRDRFKLESRHALRVSDLQEALLRYQPGIVHFSGHGAPKGLIFEDDEGNAKPLSPEAAADLFRLLKPQVQIVVLNACFSAIQAEQIAQHVPCVIGMTDEVGDKAAIQFAAAFYRALGYGMNVQVAFDLGINQLALMKLKGMEIPILFCPTCEPASLILV